MRKRLGVLDISRISTTDLAFIGDAVYELYIRRHVMEKGIIGADRLHRASVRYVRADSQAKAVRSIFDELTESERDLVKRARNRKSATRPRNAEPVTYKWATAFEALIGYLYLAGEEKRMKEIIERAVDITEG